MEDLFGIQARRNAVSDNISKAFGTEHDEQTIEKGKWSVGMTKQYQGKTWVVSGFNAKGVPLWKVQKNSSGSESTDIGKKQNNSKSNDDEKDLAEVPVGGRIKIDGVGYFKKVSKGDWVKFDPNTGKESDKRINYTKISDNGYVNGVTIVDSRGKVISSKKEDVKKEPVKLSEMKRGDTVAFVMERYNPQLGNYVTISKKQIERATSKSFVVNGNKFDKESGDRRESDSSVYGSATYSIMTEEELQKRVKDGKYNGYRISGRNPFE